MTESNPSLLAKYVPSSHIELLALDWNFVVLQLRHHIAAAANAKRHSNQEKVEEASLKENPSPALKRTLIEVVVLVLVKQAHLRLE